MASCWRLRRVPFALLTLAVGACQQQSGEGDEPPVATASATLEAESIPSTDLTCTEPVRPTDTAASLQQRYGDQARVETLYGPEGVEFPGLVLWPDDPARRLEVVLGEEGQRTVSSVGLGRESTWRVAGLAIGDPLTRANAANGKPFKLWGFSWDYGGYVSDLGGGKLAALPGGCRAVLRFGPREGAAADDALIGDVELSSDDPRLEAAEVTIEELSLAF